MRLRWVIPVAFMTSCVGFIPPATRLADPMTRSPVDHENLRGPFPVVVVNDEQAWVAMPENPHDVPPPPAGASYLVPLERTRSIERYLRDHDTVHRKSSWVLNVQALGVDRQRIELYLLGDGYWGGIYEATATTVTPLFRKVTGPGFAFIFGSLALLMNSVAWAIVASSFWWFKRRRQAAQQPAAAYGGPHVRH
ncbi:MAG TPA: hypothetical protein VGV60_03190 [Candidatus Polarisedimenticolia bacterium]|nr:hypothetical protein [Candidatus Polarisedimenticolia bacterium]